MRSLGRYDALARKSEVSTANLVLVETCNQRSRCTSETARPKQSN